MSRRHRHRHRGPLANDRSRHLDGRALASGTDRTILSGFVGHVRDLDPGLHDGVGLDDAEIDNLWVQHHRSDAHRTRGRPSGSRGSSWRRSAGRPPRAVQVVPAPPRPGRRWLLNLQTAQARRGQAARRATTTGMRWGVMGGGRQAGEEQHARRALFPGNVGSVPARIFSGHARHRHRPPRVSPTWRERPARGRRSRTASRRGARCSSDRGAAASHRPPGWEGAFPASTSCIPHRRLGGGGHRPGRSAKGSTAWDPAGARRLRSRARSARTRSGCRRDIVMIGEHRRWMPLQAAVRRPRTVDIGDADPLLAVAFGLTHLTAWRMLVVYRRLRGASRPSPESAVAGCRGAGHRGGTGMPDDRDQPQRWKLERAKALAADHGVLDTGRTESREACSLTGGSGVDAVADSVARRSTGVYIKSLAAAVPRHLRLHRADPTRRPTPRGSSGTVSP